LNDVISGRTGLDDLKGSLKFKDADQWDRKDAPPIEINDEL
jgi:hypothetical protein